jgi:cell division protease FtsH
MRSAKKLIIWVAIIGSLILLWELVKAGGPKVPEISYSEFLSQAEAGNVRRVTIADSNAQGIYRDGKPFVVILPARQDAVVELLHRHNVEIWYRDVQAKLPYWLLNLAPLLIFGTLLYLMMKQIKEIRRLSEERKAEMPGPQQAVPRVE